MTQASCFVADEGVNEYRLERTGPWWVISMRRNGLRHTQLHAACEDHVAFAPVSERGYISIAVADGVGSGARGDVCSRAAALHAVNTCVYPMEETSGQAGREQVRKCIDSAGAAVQNALRAYSSEPGASMLVAAWLDENGSGQLAHVGDARAYLCSAESAQLLTQDHSYRNTDEPPPTDSSPEDPARMIGIYTGKPDVRNVTVKSGEALLMCTDGLYGYMPEPSFLRVLVQQMRRFTKQPSAEQANALARQLVIETLAAGSDDDIAFTLAVYDAGLVDTKAKAAA